METGNPSQSRVLTIGKDRVTVGESEVIIEAAHEMPDWVVREFKPAPIYFEDKKFLLIAKNRAEKPYAWRYVLKPWPEGVDAGKGFFNYDAEAVAERDASHRSGQEGELISKALMPLYPFLGLLWTGTQRRLEKFGFVARSLTGVSVFTTFCVMFVQASCALILINGSIRSGKIAIGGIIRLFSGSDHWSLGPVNVGIVWVDAALLLALIADVLVRYTNYLREDQWCGGFLEWLFRRKSADASDKS